jgi:lambda repressor-like predicted transcriptional regulator
MARPTGHRLSPAAWADILECKGLTLTRVAARADIPRATLSSLLGGHHRASLATAAVIAETVGCRPATIFPTIDPVFIEAVNGEVW